MDPLSGPGPWTPSTGCIKKLYRFEIALNIAKQLLVSSFFMYIASLGTCNVE
jgi:hypothetical protein